MPRSGPNGTYTLPGAQDEAQPNTTIQSSINNQGWADIEQTFNTPQPIAYGGTGATDAQGAVSAIFDGTTYVLDDNLRIAASGDTSKVVKFDLSGLSTATTRTLTVPDKSGTIATTADLPAPPKGYLYGLALTTNATDASNDIDIAAGEASSDDSTPVLMNLAASLTKRIDAAWAVGTNQGGLDTGSVGDNAYYIWLIRRPDTGVVDALFSLSNTAPTMPADYTQKRLIGFVVRASAANIKPYRVGDVLYYESAPITTTSAGTTTLNHGLNVLPTDVQTWLVCTSAENGFTVGQKIPITLYVDTGSNTIGTSIIATSTTLVGRYSNSSTATVIPNASNGGRAPLSRTNFDIIYKAWAGVYTP